MQQPNMPYKVSYFVKKDENITWCMEQDWLTQFESHLDQYINNPRNKRKAHQAFAIALHTQILDIKKKKNSATLIEQEILPIITNKVNLIECGINGDKSFLFTLCEVAQLQHWNRKHLLQTIQKLEAEHKGTIQQQQLKLGQQKTQISQLQAELSSTKINLLTIKDKLENELKSARQDSVSWQEDNNHLRRKITLLEQASKRTQNELLTKDERIKVLEAELQTIASLQQTATPIPEETQSPTQQDLEQRIKQLEKENSLLRLAQEETNLKTDHRHELVLQNGELKSKITRLSDENLNLKDSKAELKSAYDFVLSIITKIFSDLSMVTISKYHRNPFNETQIRLMRRIACATPSDITPQMEDEIEQTAKKIETGQPVANFEDVFNNSINRGFTFLSNLPNAISGSHLFTSVSEPKQQTNLSVAK